MKNVGHAALQMASMLYGFHKDRVVFQMINGTEKVTINYLKNFFSIEDFNM